CRIAGVRPPSRKTGHHAQTFWIDSESGSCGDARGRCSQADRPGFIRQNSVRCSMYGNGNSGPESGNSSSLAAGGIGTAGGAAARNSIEWIALACAGRAATLLHLLAGAGGEFRGGGGVLKRVSEPGTSMEKGRSATSTRSAKPTPNPAWRLC